MKKSIVFVMIIAFLNLNCAKIYTVNQIQTDETVYTQLKGKRVEIYLTNEKKIIGYFQSIEDDSLTIIIPCKELFLIPVLSELNRFQLNDGKCEPVFFGDGTGFGKKMTCMQKSPEKISNGSSVVNVSKRSSGVNTSKTICCEI